MIEFTAHDNWECRLNTATRKLDARHAEGAEISCQLSQPEVRLLQLLLSEPGTVRNRDELIKFAWGRRPVTQNSLNHAIFNLRQAFGPRDGREIIVTVPNEGYRIQARLVGSPQALAALEEPVADAQEPLIHPPTSWLPTLRPTWRLPRLKRLPLLLLLANLGLAGITAGLLARQSAPAPQLIRYAYLKDVADLHFHVQEPSTRAGRNLDEEIRALLLAPPELGKGKPYIYINDTPSERQHSYFLCRQPIESSAPDCMAYVIHQELQP
ncbi:winged helix-turn-helix domain-containing protein [Pseudomonas knackmussii]|uniref:winged helix-turn-helix domain-containing protein n=1 Tax=Pseudomonas knackmussii TaxID=65741 RepID=UPI001363E7D0|nr:winged helix-turn-helix domain-containing protein [Pseudomonas knackmussii]